MNASRSVTTEPSRKKDPTHKLIREWAITFTAVATALGVLGAGSHYLWQWVRASVPSIVVVIAIMSSIVVVGLLLVVWVLSKYPRWAASDECKVICIVAAIMNLGFANTIMAPNSTDEIIYNWRTLSQPPAATRPESTLHGTSNGHSSIFGDAQGISDVPSWYRLAVATPFILIGTLAVAVLLMSFRLNRSALRRHLSRMHGDALQGPPVLIEQPRHSPHINDIEGKED